MTKKAMLKSEGPGLFSVDPEWEEIGKGEYILSSEPEEPSAFVSGIEKVKTEEIRPGLYIVLD
jgi:hypothetical protein